MSLKQKERSKGLSCGRITRYQRAIPLVRVSDEAQALMKVASDREEAFAQAGDDEHAMAYETTVVAEDEAYWALEGFAGDDLGGGGVVADTLAAGHSL